MENNRGHAEPFFVVGLHGGRRHVPAELVHPHRPRQHGQTGDFVLFLQRQRFRGERISHFDMEFVVFADRHDLRPDLQIVDRLSAGPFCDSDHAAFVFRVGKLFWRFYSDQRCAQRVEGDAFLK